MHWVSPTAHSITCDIKGGGDFRRATPEKRLSQSPGCGTLYNGVSVVALTPPPPPPPRRERDTFFRLKVYQRVGIFPVEVYERVGKSVISVRKKAQNLGLTDFFMAMKKWRKRSGFVIYFYF